MKLGSIEKDKQPSLEITRLFEKTRVAYLSAKTDPQEYGGRWRKAVDLIIESYNELDSAGKELNNFIDEKDLTRTETKNPTSREAQELYENIKLLRYSSEVVADPFAERFKGNVLEELLSNPESMLKFVHYALRNDSKPLSKEVLSIKDMEPDSITAGLMGLDIESEDIALYIIEHYGDGKDSKKVESKVKAAMDILELVFFSQHEEKEWTELKDIAKADERKSATHFIIPNKPMYRIFEIDDIKELKGFSGDWYVQEKYDGMRIQLHKLDNKVTIYSYNAKDITDKCPEQVKELKKKEYGDCILDAELILFKGEESLHRADTVAHVFKGKYKDADLRCHVFDIIRHESQTLTDEELDSRMKILFNNYSSKTNHAIAYPSKKDTREADNLQDIETYAKDMMEIPTSEGVVIKDATSTYYIGTKKNPKWIKWKKFVDLDVMVLTKNKTKSNLYSYGLGIGPVTEDLDNLVEIKGFNYMNVGKALNTKISVDVGDIIRVKVDEVKKKGETYSLYSAKVIEVPEVILPDKLVTLEFLSRDTKKSLNYDVEALTKGIRVTDYIHGETNLIIKSGLDGFTIYGFEEDNLMSKNALNDLDMWKQQAIDIMKSKQSELTVAIFQYLKTNGPKTANELHAYLKEKHTGLYEEVLDSDKSKVKEWSSLRDGISTIDDKLSADDDKIMQEEEIKKSFIRKKQQLIQRLKEQEKEEESAITIDIDKEGDCCTQLKNKIIEDKRETLEYLLENTSWEERKNDPKMKGTAFHNANINSLEEKMAEFSEIIMGQQCDYLILDYLQPEKYEEDKEMMEEYNQCSFGEGFSDKFAMLKAYKTPKELREGQFKLYSREDDNLTLAIKLNKETMFWTIELDDQKELFDLFGAAGKYPAEVSKNLERGKVVDSGKIELGVQKDGYHEYFLEGNKFETKMHFRVIPVKGKTMWLAWTGFKQQPADDDSDEGKWNIYTDRYNKLPLPNKK